MRLYKHPYPYLCMYVCMCVCVYVCVCVCVCGSSVAQTDEWILMKFSTNDLINICEVCFSRILKFPNRWRHGGHFFIFVFILQSHGRNFAQIFFKTAGKAESCLMLFAIENHLNWFIILPIWLTALKKIPKWPP